MKKDWTYKKLGEVCDILNGYAFKSNKYVGEGIRVIRIANVQKGIIVDDQPAFYPLSTQFEIDKYILNEGDILMSLTGNVGRVGILQKEMLPAALNQRVACLRMIDNSLYSKFFFHYLNSDLFEQKCIASARGIAQLNMSTEWLKEQFIPIPSIAIQRSIVAELDLLHSVISKKKEQLRELDNLAQSLFYQMFGDPITNPMGWEKTYLKDKVQEMFLGPFGSALKVSCYVPQDESYCMVYEQKHAIKGSLNVETHYIDQQKFNELERFNVRGGDFIMSCRGTIGKIYQLPQDAPLGIIHPSLMKIRLKKDSFTPCFFLSLLSKIVANESTNGNCVQMAITAKDLGNKLIIYPPLSLQQSFAAKVIAIEAQKQAITQSIQHTEALLAQRMDHYFA